MRLVFSRPTVDPSRFETAPSLDRVVLRPGEDVFIDVDDTVLSTPWDPVTEARDANEAAPLNPEIPVWIHAIAEGHRITFLSARKHHSPDFTREQLLGFGCWPAGARVIHADPKWPHLGSSAVVFIDNEGRHIDDVVQNRPEVRCIWIGESE